MLCLALGFGMLTWGRMVLLPHLSGLGFVLYWAFCLLLATAATVVGAADIWFLLRALRQERLENVRLAEQQLRGDDPGHRRNPEA